MAVPARKLFLRHFKEIRQRHLSISAMFKNRDNDEFVIKSRLPDIVIPNMRFLDRLWIEASGFQNHVAVESIETKKSYTYNQLRKTASTFATSLRKRLGLSAGDVVAVMMPNCPEFVAVALGTLEAGCVLTTINPIYKEYEVGHQAKTTEPKVVVTIPGERFRSRLEWNPFPSREPAGLCKPPLHHALLSPVTLVNSNMKGQSDFGKLNRTPECYDVVAKGLRDAQINAKIVIVDNPTDALPDTTIRYSEIAESGEIDYSLLDKVEKRQDDVAFIPFSSGTTGLPKGVEISYKNILSALEVMGMDETCYVKLTHGTHQDILPCILPFFHVYGLVVTLIGHLTKGAKLITMNKFSANAYFDILKTENISLLYIVPPIAVLLGKHPDVKPEFFRAVRHIVCGAAPLSGLDVQAVLERSQRNIEFNQGFGATETTSLATCTFIGTKVLDYSASGEPMGSNQLKFVDTTTGQPVPVGQSGELYIKSPLLMKGYHRNEAATKDCMTEDGYFKTGDLGHYDPERGLFITERIKELIKVKGMQVAPAELESILRSHPSIQEAAVIGVPHEFYGETPKAFVMTKNGAKITAEEIQDFVASKVAPFKKIEEVVFVNDIPKTASGKILRKDLKKMYA